MKKRSIYLDILKVIAILCVCSYHFSWAGNIEYSENMTIIVMFRRFVYELSCIGVPLFFMVNGSLVFSRDYTTGEWVKNMLCIVLQLLVWRGLTLFALCKTLKISLLEKGTKYLMNGIFFGQFEGVNLSYLWFIYALIIVYLLYPFFKSAYDSGAEHQKYLWIFLAILCVLCFATKSWTTLVKVVPALGGIELENIRNFLGFDGIYGAMLCYFIMGGMINKYKEKCKQISYVWIIAAFAVAAAALYIKWIYESKAINATYDSVFWGYDCMAGAVLSLCVYLFILKKETVVEKIPEILKKFTWILGKNTLGVYYLHWLAGYILLPLCYEKLAGYSGLVLNFVKAALLVIVCSILSEVLGRIPVVGYLVEKHSAHKK